MSLQQALQKVDVNVAREFVKAAKRVIDAMLLETARATPEPTPGRRDYETAGFSREAPAGGWISAGELRRTTQLMSEAIAAEKWTEGVMLAVRALGGIG
jgi:hypothetical protein